MPESLPRPTARELRRAAERSAEDRYSYTIQRVRANDGVWAVVHEEGFAVLEDEESGGPFIIVFPEPECAEEWSETAELEGAELGFIPVSEWRTDILPDLAKSGIMIQTFPTADDDGAIVEADAMAKDLGNGRKS